MSPLAPAHARHKELAALLIAVQDEGEVDVDATKETRYLRQGGSRFAVVDADDRVVGYLSGSLRNGSLVGHEVPDGAVVAFISLVLIEPTVRSKGLGYEAIREFAQLAHQKTGATIIGLNLDPCGDVAVRRRRFERMGFEFVADTGRVDIAMLLMTTEDERPLADGAGLPTSQTEDGE